MIQFLLLGANLSLHNMLLQPFVEIAHANTSVDYRGNNQDNGDNSETGQRFSYGFVIMFLGWCIHPSELVNEVRQTAEVQDNGTHHTKLIFAASKEYSQEQDEHRDRDGSNSQSELYIALCRNDDEELYCEAKEEEEIELQQRNVNLQHDQIITLVQKNRNSPERPEIDALFEDPQRCVCISSMQIHHKASMQQNP